MSSGIPESEPLLWPRRLTELARALPAHRAAEKIGEELARLARSGELAIPERLRRPPGSGYARRLVHRDPLSGLTVLALAWPVGSGTPLHDHAGLWGVECVAEGEIEVELWELLEERPDGLCRFARREQMPAGVGEIGTVVPPLEHHVLRNPGPDRAVTVHVYGGELDHCDVFLPASEEGLFHREHRTLSLTD